MRKYFMAMWGVNRRLNRLMGVALQVMGGPPEPPSPAAAAAGCCSSSAPEQPAVSPGP